MATYSCSDLHGNMILWNKIRRELNDSDTLIMLGDCADRGLYGWQILKEVLSTPNVKYIRGNHDEMLLDRVRSFNSLSTAGLHIQNGGEPTWSAMCGDKMSNIFDTMFDLDYTPYSYVYSNPNGKRIYLSHSGYCGTDKVNLIWSRACFQMKPSSYGYDYIVHGHTPIQYLDKNLVINKAYYYHNGRIDIDAGTYTSKISILLNLDTLESKIISEI